MEILMLFSQSRHHWLSFEGSVNVIFGHFCDFGQKVLNHLLKGFHVSFLSYFDLSVGYLKFSMVWPAYYICINFPCMFQPSCQEFS